MGYQLKISNLTTKATIIEAGARFTFTDASVTCPIRVVSVAPGGFTIIDSGHDGKCTKIEGVIVFRVGQKTYPPMSKTIDNPNGIPQPEAVMMLVQSPKPKEAGVEAPVNTSQSIPEFGLQ